MMMTHRKHIDTPCILTHHRQVVFSLFVTHIINDIHEWIHFLVAVSMLHFLLHIPHPRPLLTIFLVVRPVLPQGFPSPWFRHCDPSSSGAAADELSHR